jgi:hypothetical protein
MGEIMNHTFFRSAVFFFTAAALFLAGFVVASVARLPLKDVGDLATWVGAIFAGFAFGGTIWIASSQARQVRAEQTALAMIHAAATRGKVTDALPRLRIALKVLNEHIRSNSDKFDFCAEQIRDFEIWTADELIVFAGLPKRCATRLALAREIILFLRRIFADQNAATDENVQRSLLQLNHAIHLVESGAASLDTLMAIDVDPGWLAR